MTTLRSRVDKVHMWVHMWGRVQFVQYVRAAGFGLAPFAEQLRSGGRRRRTRAAGQTVLLDHTRVAAFPVGPLYLPDTPSVTRADAIRQRRRDLSAMIASPHLVGYLGRYSALLSASTITTRSSMRLQILLTAMAKTVENAAASA